MNKAEARHAMNWAVKKLGLDAWTIHLYTSPKAPLNEFCSTDDSKARVLIREQREEAHVWVRLDRGATVQHVFHEMAHIWFVNSGEDIQEHTLLTEFRCNRLADIMVLAYPRHRRSRSKAVTP